MPKKKTSKTAAKRVKKTGTGKLKFGKPGTGHLLSSKSPSRKRRLRKASILGSADIKRINNLLG